MFCTKCGAELPEGTRFCPACGTPAAAAGVASSTAPATPSMLHPRSLHPTTNRVNGAGLQAIRSVRESRGGPVCVGAQQLRVNCLDTTARRAEDFMGTSSCATLARRAYVSTRRRIGCAELGRQHPIAAHIDPVTGSPSVAYASDRKTSSSQPIPQCCRGDRLTA